MWPLWIRDTISISILVVILFDTIATLVLLTVVRRLGRKLRVLERPPNPTE